MSELPRMCHCGILERYRHDPLSGIRFDERLNEYSIIGQDANSTGLLMRYCPWCGGQLPASKRGELFYEIDPEEERQVREINASIRSLDDAYRVLGTPDLVFVPEPSEYEKFRSRKQVTYNRRWRTLTLTILDQLDGRAAFTYAPKLKDLPPEESRKPSPNLWQRLIGRSG